MKKRMRPTGCTKFFLLILIVAPLAFIGVSIYRGESPKENFNTLIGSEQKDLNSIDKKDTIDLSNNPDCATEIKQLEQQLSDMERQIIILKAHNEQLLIQIEQLKNK